MIDLAIAHIAGQLNQYLRRSFELTEDIVVVSNILEQDGNLAPNVDNKLVVSLVNIEKEAVTRPLSNGNTWDAGHSIVSYPPVYLNFYLLFAGNFGGSNYLESLKFVSNTISFFQGQPKFDHQSTPDLDDRIDQLTMSIENLTMDNLSNLWSILSGKYLPSILYKVRMIAFDPRDIRTRVTTIIETDSSVRTKPQV